MASAPIPPWNWPCIIALAAYPSLDLPTISAEEAEIYGPEKVRRALEDAWAYQAFSCEYIANLLEQQARPPVQPGALHLTRQQDLLDLELPAPDLSLYESPEGGAA